MSARPFDRLVARLRDAGHTVPEGLTLHRTWAGFWQRAEGAWLWFALDELGGEVLAGFEPVGVLARAERLAVESAPGSSALVVTSAR